MRLIKLVTRGWGMVLIGLISLLTGCSTEAPYQQRQGVWHYRGQPMQLPLGQRLTPLSDEFAKTEQRGYFRGLAILESDGQSFQVLSPHYAKDRQQVYYCFARRKSQDYFTTQESVVMVLKADPASFQVLRYDYAKDRQQVFYEGVPFAVKAVGSFELLDHTFARDQITGYYSDSPIIGSDGSSFVVLGTRYARDRAHVFYAFTDLSSSPPVIKSLRLEGALLDSFEVISDGYAKDAQRAYHNGKALPGADGGTIAVLSRGYAKTKSQVFYEGRLLRGADAASFALVDSSGAEADARDSKSGYRQGKRVNN
jgi:hypothetical protein